jgi:hypothetical protein
LPYLVLRLALRLGEHYGVVLPTEHVEATRCRARPLVDGLHQLKPIPREPHHAFLSPSGPVFLPECVDPYSVPTILLEQSEKNKDSIANGNFRKVIRLMKYLRDHKNSFTGTRSIILTTLLGEQVTQLRVASNPGYYSNVPTTLLHVIKDLDAWLQARPAKPSILDPSNPKINFDHRWDSSAYSYFRDRIHAHTAEIEEAYEEPDKDRSVQKWQAIFGYGFKAPITSSSSQKFPAAAPGAASTVRRSGRAG